MSKVFLAAAAFTAGVARIANTPASITPLMRHAAAHALSNGQLTPLNKLLAALESIKGSDAARLCVATLGGALADLVILPGKPGEFARAKKGAAWLGAAQAEVKAFALPCLAELVSAERDKKAAKREADKEAAKNATPAAAPQEIDGSAAPVADGKGSPLPLSSVAAAAATLGAALESLTGATDDRVQTLADALGASPFLLSLVRAALPVVAAAEAAATERAAAEAARVAAEGAAQAAAAAAALKAAEGIAAAAVAVKGNKGKKRAAIVTSENQAISAQEVMHQRDAASDVHRANAERIADAVKGGALLAA